MSRSREQPAQFDWPEPLVIEIIAERYQDFADDFARVTIARLQAIALRELFAGRSRQAASVRIELLATCAACKIPTERIHRTDLAVVLELTRVAEARFRTSPRLKGEVCARLDATLDELQAEPATPARQRAASAGPRGLRPAAAIG